MQKILIMKTTNTFLLILLAVMAGGCASTGLTASSHVTNVQLSSPNFRVIATNVQGEASSKGLLGVSYGLGLATTQLVLIPLTDDRTLYQTAIRNFWSNFETKYGPASGRRLALVNFRYDSESTNLFFFTKVRTIVVADVVEFQ